MEKRGSEWTEVKRESSVFAVRVLQLSCVWGRGGVKLVMGARSSPEREMGFFWSGFLAIAEGNWGVWWGGDILSR